MTFQVRPEYENDFSVCFESLFREFGAALKIFIYFDFLGELWSPQKFYGAIFQRLLIRHCDWSGQKFEDAEYLRYFFSLSFNFQGNAFVRTKPATKSGE